MKKSLPSWSKLSFIFMGDDDEDEEDDEEEEDDDEDNEDSKEFLATVID